jgi:squalene-hopene/tetraprenyl-beta-curcumene cyclase
VKSQFIAVILWAYLMAALVSATSHVQGDGIGSWDPQAAAAYLDERQAWWFDYPSATREGTTCVSCHTALPYALARPALRPRLNERRPSATETKLIGDVVKRVRAWRAPCWR